jgi:predicted nucleic acid-binding protein
VSLLVVADNSPISYLCEIGQIEILPRLFGEVHIPVAVYHELCHPKTPAVIREWALKLPPWLKVASTLEKDDPSTDLLDAGERAAIAMAERLKADLVLMDERLGTRICRARGFETTGTLGILIRAATSGKVNLHSAFDRLKATNFRYSPQMLEQLLKQHEGDN